MDRSARSLVAVAFAAAVLSGAVPADAQPAAALPTKENPLVFSALAVRDPGGILGALQIAIERWSTDSERGAVAGFLSGTTDRPEDQQKLVQALQSAPRVGYVSAPRSLGWDVKYAYQRQLSDGSRQIVVATDKPLSYLSDPARARQHDYGFSLIEMRFPAGSDKGEGRLLAESALSVKDGMLQIGTYGQEPTRLTDISLMKPKDSK